ncbi:MAG: hypothetical protein ABIY70_07935 [Capsulimonas sp.]|uniref:hypothetical protein n=1 Tax=Capsulimonas sp. TaxID=2494211 RepID=UPI003263D7DE
MRKIRIRKRFMLIPAAALGATALALILWRHPVHADTPANRNAIYTAVFQKMMARRQRPYTGLSVGGEDPGIAMMNSFRNAKGVIPASRIQMGVIKDMSGFMVPGTGKFAEIFSVHPDTLQWSGPSRVSIEAGAHGSGSDGSEGTYSLVRVGDHWTVTGYVDSGLMF